MLASRPTGMRAFTLVWFGQFISLTGTAMTGFALTIWAFELTRQATALALVAFFAFTPTVLFSPIAGVLVDRWNRKLVMMISDLGGGFSTIAILLLYSSGNLQIWHLYLATSVAAVGQAFQWPAYSASIALMLPKGQYGRAQGMLALAESGSGILAPIFAGALIGVIGIGGIMLIDIATFCFAIGALLIVFIPQPQATQEGAKGRGSFLTEAVYGFRYIVERPSLLGLQLTFFFINLTGSLQATLVAPMILARTNSDQGALAIVQSAGAVGGVISGLLLTAWGGPKRRVRGVLGGMALGGLLSGLFFGLGAAPPIWGAGALLGSFFGVIVNGSNQAIWQAKVAPDVQGRVFAARRLIAQVSAPLSILLAGPLADRVFGPAMMEGGSLVPALGRIFGVGQGAGIAVLITINAFLELFIGLGAYLIPAVRNAEDILPDHTQAAAQAEPVLATSGD